MVKDAINGSRIINENTKQRYKNYHLMNASFKCNNTLLSSFNLIGKFSNYGKLNDKPIYCPSNLYTCCSESQLETSMLTFGKGMVNLRKDLEPIIELSMTLKTKQFVNFISRWHQKPICSNIIKLGFNKDPLGLNFSLKKFVNSLIK